MCSNDISQCELLPSIQSLIKIQMTNGPVFRNKLVNALIFALKLISQEDDENLKEMFPHEVKKRKTALIIIGALRIILKSNSNLTR
jgi:hypothetical protein